MSDTKFCYFFFCLFSFYYVSLFVLFPGTPAHPGSSLEWKQSLSDSKRTLIFDLYCNRFRCPNRDQDSAVLGAFHLTDHNRQSLI